MMRKQTVFLAIALFGVIVWAIFHLVEESKHIVTFNEAKQVWEGASLEGNGLTYAEVVAIVGAEGVPCDEPSTEVQEELGAECYSWTNLDDSGWMKADFVDGRLRYVRIDSALAEQ